VLRIILLKFCAVDVYSFFYDALPTEGVLSLEDLHTIIRDIWLPRYDPELEEEKAARRKGRPKSVREQKIEDLKLREAELYRTGMGQS
jgi:translation machinery-associated protein 16